MNKRELKIKVFKSTWLGKFLTAIEMSLLMAISAILAVSLLEKFAVTPEIAQKENSFFQMTMMMSACLSSIYGFIIGYIMPYSLIIGKILPINKKAAKRYLKEQREKIAIELSEETARLEQMKIDYNNLVGSYKQDLAQKKITIEETQNLETML